MYVCSARSTNEGQQEKCLCNQCSHHEIYGPFMSITDLKVEVAIMLCFQQCSERTVRKALCNQSSNYRTYGRFPFTNVGKSSSYQKSTPWIISKQKWNIKEDKGKCMKYALYVLQYAKRHISGIK